MKDDSGTQSAFAAKGVAGPVSYIIFHISYFDMQVATKLEQK